MVLRRNIRIIFVLLFFSCLTLIFSCEENGAIVNCNDCLLEEPFDATINVKLTSFNESNFTNTVIVYEGNIEEGNVLMIFTTVNESISFTVPLNKKYTVTSSFYSAGNYYTTVDAFIPRVKYDRNSCDQPCYYIYGTKLNLKRKYQ